MTKEIGEITPWIPVIGTLLGVTLGFVASAVNSKFSNDRKEKNEKKQRDRDRVERIFRLLIAINSEVAKEMGELMIYIHHSTPIENKALQDFPPLLELEMLTTLYFPSLENERINLKSSVQAFGKSSCDFRMKNYVNIQKEAKQKDCGVLIALHSRVDKHITLFKDNLTKHVEP